MSVAADRKADYHRSLQYLSEASVDRHFDAFVDVPWDDPDFVVAPDDPRWVLPVADPLGATDWYRSLPLQRRIEVGRYRYAAMYKVGLQFEQILISGLMNYALKLPNNSAEFRYSTHEATEECHHTQMFQEAVNRIGVDVKGGPRWFRAVGPLLALAAGPVPFGFFIGVLAGEEPIDYFQKTLLRADVDAPPLMKRLTQIHVAEEARHIGFAHEYLQYRAPRLGRLSRFMMSIAMPIIMRVLCDVIMKPTRHMRREMGIPREVVAQVWWDSDVSRKRLRDTFGDVRMLAVELDLVNPLSRTVWRALKIDGRPSRFRSEPKSAAA